MVRTTAVAVGGIIEVDAAISVTPFIEAANALVTEVCTSDTYDAARLELIEKWLSAHFYAQRDVRVSSEGAGGISQGFESVVALGFDNTRFGQMAMRLDTVGGLAALNESTKKGKRKIASLTWLGTEEEDVTDEDDEV